MGRSQEAREELTLSSPGTPQPSAAFVLYKLPHSHTFTRISQDDRPEEFRSLLDVPLTGGYVVAPFAVTEAKPILFIRPQRVERGKLQTPCLSRKSPVRRLHEDEERTHYHEAFGQTKRALLRGEAGKAVLSRRLDVVCDCPVDTEELFFRACHYRPGSFVALWHTPQTGSWLVATPEPLLENSHHNLHTVALAGTLPYEANIQPRWNAKNRQEQAVVARFVRECLANVCQNVKQSETYTLTTGNLQHLCTDFTFNLDNPGDVLQLLQQLHPTPAVCGLPREWAMQHIVRAESAPRRYYAGFSGPLFFEGETSLYVSLRCMNFTPRSATLYAGGGIMPDSEEDEEWLETERKLATMLDLF